MPEASPRRGPSAPSASIPLAHDGSKEQRRMSRMRHHIIYWKMSRREADVDDVQLAALREEERLGDVYIEFLDGERLPLTWDHEARH
jgi:hypothetical protein